MPISKSVPSALTWNSSTVPAPPLVTYRKRPFGVAAESVVPASVEAACPMSTGTPLVPTWKALSVALPALDP